MLGLGQMAATILVLLVGKWTRVITYPGLSKDTWRKIWPLPLFYIGALFSFYNHEMFLESYNIKKSKTRKHDNFKLNHLHAIFISMNFGQILSVWKPLFWKKNKKMTELPFQIFVLSWQETCSSVLVELKSCLCRCWLYYVDFRSWWRWSASSTSWRSWRTCPRSSPSTSWYSAPSLRQSMISHLILGYVHALTSLTLFIYSFQIVIVFQI